MFSDSLDCLVCLEYDICIDHNFRFRSKMVKYRGNIVNDSKFCVVINDDADIFETKISAQIYLLNVFV